MLASVLALGACSGRPAIVSHAGPVRTPALSTPSETSEHFLAAEPSGTLRARLDAVAQAFRERGAHPVADRWVTFLPPRSTATMRVHTARGGCLGFVAVGRENLQDIDLWVHNTAGVRLAQDLRDDAHPYVRVCPRANDELFVIVRAAQGAGEVGVLTVVDPPVVPPDLATVLGVRASGTFTGPRTPRAAIGDDPAAPDVTHALDRWIQRLNLLGYRQIGGAITGTLEMQRQQEHTVPLNAGACYAIVAAGDQNVEDLDLRVIAPTGNVLGQDVATDSHPVVKICPAISGPHRVQVRMYAGAGRYALATLVMDPAIDLGDDVVGLARAHAFELAAQGRRHGMVLLSPPVRYAVVPGVVASIPVRLRAGRCYLFGAAPSETLSGLSLSLVDDHGAVLSSSTATRSPVRVFHCSQRSLRARVEVRPGGGRGEYVFVPLESRGTTP